MSKNIKQKEHFKWRVDTVALLNEIADCGLPKTMGVLRAPINIFRILLCEVAQRATEINDPELNILMLRLKLYEVPHYKISKAIEVQKKLIKKHGQTKD